MFHHIPQFSLIHLPNSLDHAIFVQFRVRPSDVGIVRYSSKMLKKSASGVPCLRRSGFAQAGRAFVGFALRGLALFTPFALMYSVYAPGTKALWPCLRKDASCRSQVGRVRQQAFLNRPFACEDSWNWSDGIGALKIVMYSTGPPTELQPLHQYSLFKTSERVSFCF